LQHKHYAGVKTRPVLLSANIEDLRQGAYAAIEVSQVTPVITYQLWGIDLLDSPSYPALGDLHFPGFEITENPSQRGLSESVIGLRFCLPNNKNNLNSILCIAAEAVPTLPTAHGVETANLI
jgi:hypothetical protein